ncbi:hypothetical protein [Actinocorallia longicatena]|uniref:Uncharacterized protein n=1 Tax=Actinocorallia longicatena TaxID=111803 RepID=A0ABP6QL40_9ACTN
MGKRSDRLPACTLYSTPLRPFGPRRITVRAAAVASAAVLVVAAAVAWPRDVPVPLAFPGRTPTAQATESGGQDRVPPLPARLGAPGPEASRTQDEAARDGRPAQGRPVQARPRPSAEKPVSHQVRPGKKPRKAEPRPVPAWVSRECSRRFPRDQVRREACRAVLEKALG